MSSSSSRSSELSESSKVVLKLSLGEGDKAQVRRITLSRLWENGKVSYNRLISIVREHSLEEAEVTITYDDEDGDVITISTDDELADAFGQFVESQPPVLRVKGHVKEVEKEKAAPKASSSFPRERTARTARSERGRTGPQIHALLESFVSILATAVLALQEKVSHTCPPSTTSATSTTTTTTTTQQQQDAERLARNALHTALHNTKHKQQVFVHGRHTCDGCLTTPITGTRYHATNLPDYDLCTKCFDNYEGTDIHFQPEILERDRPMQQRWTRRHNKPRNNASSLSPGMSFPGRRGHRIRQLQQQEQNFQDSLKEAIRQSLEDIHDNKKVDETQQVRAEEKKAEEVETDQPFENELASVAPSVTTSVTPSVTTEEQDMKEPAIPSDAASTTTPLPATTNTTPPTSPDRTSYSSEAKECGSIAERIGETLDHVADAIDTIVHEFENSHISMEQVLQDMEAASDVSDDEDEEEVVDSISAMTSSLASVAVPFAMEDDIVETVEEEDEDVEEGSFKTPPEEEPTLEGGATILSSVGTTAPANVTVQEVSPPQLQEDDTEVDEWDVVDEVDDVQEQIANDDALARAATLIGSALFQSDLADSFMGQSTNAESRNARNDTATASTAHSVTSSASVVSDGFSVDSIPSSVDSNIQSISSSHAPTSDTAPLSTAVLTQWQSELAQLHELGFLDDKVNVDALESLQAANIGAGLDDVVSVNDAVLRILNH